MNRAPFLQRRRSARSQAGLTLVEVFLAITLTALLSVPVFGMVIVVLRTGGGSDSVLSQQADEINVQLQRNLRVIETESQLREDWRQASIIKVNPPLDFGQGIECNNGTSSAALNGVGYFNVGPIITLQRPALNGQDLGGPFTGKVPGVAGSKGMVRVVYNLVTRRALGVPVTRPDGSYLRDLVRRECAVESTGLPAVRAALPSDGCPEVAQVPVGYVTTDCAGWRLKPGTINSG
ncbi:MAG: PulJ/GspJ family protein, partial [Microthrixaceae bacterium]